MQCEHAHGGHKEVAAAAGSNKEAGRAEQATVASTGEQYAAAKPVGQVASTASAAIVAESHDIHSDVDHFRWDEYDEPEVATIGELDPQVTDPKRILNRMRGITGALQRRSARLEKAQQDRETQRQVVEQAKLLLQAKEEAVTTVENDLQYLKSVHTDLAKRYTAFTEAKPTSMHPTGHLAGGNHNPWPRCGSAH